MIDSRYEWECPVCGHYINLHRDHIGDPLRCPICGHTMRPKQYSSFEINPWDIKWMNDCIREPNPWFYR